MVEIEAKVVLTDIEGTTTSISFVKDVLFPYAKEHCGAFLVATWDQENTRQIVAQLQACPLFEDFLEEYSVKEENVTTPQTMAEFVNLLIDSDLKLGPLKALQGFVWEKGYADGSLKGHVYDDVPKAFKIWHDAGMLIAIYSSGSVKAQQMLFHDTTEGNLTNYLCAYFDTGVGHKQEVQSYVNIVNKLGVAAPDILFLTDIPKEAEAARSAGMQTVILSRPGNAGLTDDEKSTFQVIETFDSLKLKVK